MEPAPAWALANPNASLAILGGSSPSLLTAMLSRGQRGLRSWGTCPGHLSPSFPGVAIETFKCVAVTVLRAQPLKLGPQ